MKVLEVILRAASGQVSWRQAAETLGISDRSMRRWREREEAGGYEELFDGRKEDQIQKRRGRNPRGSARVHALPPGNLRLSLEIH
jgi:hypothetical protein